MPILHEHKTIFIHIPKTGGQSVSKMIGIAKRCGNMYCRNVAIEPTHYTLDMIESEFNTDDYYKFAFVQNPYTRIISQYHHRMKNTTSKHEPTNKEMSFEDYVITLYQRWDEITNVSHYYKSHVVPMFEYINESVDIYRFEQFSDECLSLCDQLEIVRDVHHINQSDGKTRHTTKTIELTSRLYEKDFNKFGYSFA